MAEVRSAKHSCMPKPPFGLPVFAGGQVDQVSLIWLCGLAVSGFRRLDVEISAHFDLPGVYALRGKLKHRRFGDVTVNFNTYGRLFVGAHLCQL